MALKNRVIEIAYRLRDEFSRRIGSITGALERVEGNSKKAARGIEEANQRISKSFSRVSGIVKTALSGLVTFSSGAIIGSIVKINSDLETLKVRLETVSGSAEQAGEDLGALRDWVKTTTLSLGEAVEAFVRLKALGLDPSIDALQSYANTAAAMGTSVQQFIEAVADAAVGEFERLKEFGIKAKSEGESVAFTFAGVTTRVGKNAAEIQQYLRSIGDVNFAGAVNKQLDTISGAYAKLKGTLSEIAQIIGEGGLNETIKEELADITKFLQENFENIRLSVDVLVGTLTVAASTIRIAWNGATAVVAEAGVLILKTTELINLALSKITFGDLSRLYERWAGQMNRLSKSLKKGIIQDMEDIKNAAGDIGDVFEDPIKRTDTSEKEANDRKNKELSRYTKEREALLAINARELENASEQEKKIAEDQLETLKENLKAKESAYRKHVSNIEDLLEKRKDLNKQFDSLKEDLASDAEPDEPPDLRDIQDLRAQAGKQIAEGEFDDAIESAQKAAELLRQMKEEGTESNIVLAGTAEILRQLAIEASEGKEKSLLVDAEKTKTEVDGVKEKVEQLKAAIKGDPATLTVVINTADAERQVAALRAKIAAEPIVIRTVGSSGEPSFTDGKEISDFGSIVSSEAAKRGAAL